MPRTRSLALLFLVAGFNAASAQNYTFTTLTFTVASNDTWGGDPALASAFVSAGAFSLPSTSRDAAVDVRLPPDGYTVTVSGVAGATGRVLVEIYDLDP
jgi:hypothetical protein